MDIRQDRRVTNTRGEMTYAKLTIKSRDQLRLPRKLLILAVSTVLVLVQSNLQNSEAIAQSLEKSSQDPVPALSNLKEAFRTAYDEAIANHGTKLSANYPVITQDLLNMTLIRPNGNKLRYSMDKRMYFLMAHSSHPPLTIYSILSKDGFGTLSNDTVTALENYQQKIGAAEAEIKSSNLNQVVRNRILRILEFSRKYLAVTIRDKSASRIGFIKYANQIRPALEANLNRGALEQLKQFKAQVEKWRTEFPSDNWRELKVVVMGFHQAREMYALDSFFRWLLREPTYEKRVVYAEFPDSISGPNRERAEQLALLLLTKVDFDLGASSLIFGHPDVLEKDVMGPAAARILRSWGSSPWRN